MMDEKERWASDVWRPRRTPQPYVARRIGERWVVDVGGREYDVDVSKPPFDFLLNYISGKLRRGWKTAQASLPVHDQHPLFRWLSSALEFHRLAQLDANWWSQHSLDFRARSLVLLATDLLTLDKDRVLQHILLERLHGADSFQGALHEVSVAATMIREGFAIRMEDERRGVGKHPEFIATHPTSGVRIAVEAKSRHRTGVLGHRSGKAPPIAETASRQELAAEVFRLVRRAIPKANGLPLYVFVDLNVPPNVADVVGESWEQELADLFGRVDPPYEHGVKVGKTINMLMIANRAMYYGEEEHREGGDMSVFCLAPDAASCRHPTASAYVESIVDAMQQYGTVNGSFVERFWPRLNE